jgi:hypothetical protein
MHCRVCDMCDVLGAQPEREQVTQLMFEELVVNGFFVVDQPVLSLYCVGKLSGCVVDIGHGKIGDALLPFTHLLLVCLAIFCFVLWFCV